MTPGTTDVTMADVYGDPDGRTERGKDERELTDEEAEAFRRAHLFASDDKATAEAFPRMFNVSAGFIYHAVIRAEVPDRPEYVTITLPEPWSDEQSVAIHNAVAQWNLLWEAAQFRRRFFDEDDLPPQLARIADRGDVNVVFVPRSGSRYHQYAPLYHPLPGRTLERFDCRCSEPGSGRSLRGRPAPIPTCQPTSSADSLRHGPRQCGGT